MRIIVCNTQELESKETGNSTFFDNDKFFITIKNKDEENFDLKLTDLILKQKVASPEIMQKLVDNKKIEVEGIQEVIDKYKTGGDNND